MTLTTEALRRGIAAIAAELEDRYEVLNELDGQVGDGDLGITLVKAFRELDTIKADLPDDLGQAFMQCAGAVSRVSSSSFGTLFATGLMAAAKRSKGTAEVPWSDMPDYLDGAIEALSARGKASLGDKTVMDALSGAARAVDGKSDAAEVLNAAIGGVDDALERFRDQPSKVGRARIFADKTIGLDDAGMVAVRMMLAWIAGDQRQAD